MWATDSLGPLWNTADHNHGHDGAWPSMTERGPLSGSAALHPPREDGSGRRPPAEAGPRTTTPITHPATRSAPRRRSTCPSPAHHNTRPQHCTNPTRMARKARWHLLTHTTPRPRPELYSASPFRHSQRPRYQRTCPSPHSHSSLLSAHCSVALVRPSGVMVPGYGYAADDHRGGASQTVRSHAGAWERGQARNGRSSRIPSSRGPLCCPLW
jgi:hypothetical protein